MLGGCIGFILGISFCRFPMSIAPTYFIRLNFIGYLVILRLFDLHPTLDPLILVKQDLALPPNHHLLTMAIYKQPLRPFRRSKCSSKLMLLLRMLLFAILSKSATTSFMGCLLPWQNISRTVGVVWRLDGIGISLMANHLILLPQLLFDCFVLLSFPFSLCKGDV